MLLTIGICSLRGVQERIMDNNYTSVTISFHNYVAKTESNVLVPVGKKTHAQEQKRPASRSKGESNQYLLLKLGISSDFLSIYSRRKHQMPTPKLKKAKTIRQVKLRYNLCIVQ